jgi:hypothetical protein
MHCPRSAVLAIGLTLCGCDGTLDSLSGSSYHNGYVTDSYYGAPIYSAQGYYPQPYYGAPYGYQPGYIPSYPYQPGWGRGNGWREREWQEREWQERRGQAFRNEGHSRYIQPNQGAGNIPHMAVQPPSLGRAAPPQQLAPQPPPAATSQADQNRKLIDQLGFRPSR